MLSGAYIHCIFFKTVIKIHVKDILYAPELLLTALTSHCAGMIARASLKTRYGKRPLKCASRRARGKQVPSLRDTYLHSSNKLSSLLSLLVFAKCAMQMLS